METTESARARTQKCREQAWATWREYGHSESVMVAVLEHLLETIEQLREGK